MLTRKSIKPEQYQEAYELFSEYARTMLPKFNKLHKHLKYTFDPAVGVNVSNAAYDDIDRYKSYHLRNKRSGGREERSDVVKRAAYLTKWICKLRPVMIRRMKEYDLTEDLALLINEVIAIGYAQVLMRAELKKKFRLSDKAFFELQYDLHYRQMTDDALVAYFQMIKDLVIDGRPNPIVEFTI